MSLWHVLALGLPLLAWGAKVLHERNLDKQDALRAEARRRAELRGAVNDLVARGEAIRAERERPDPTPEEIAAMRQLHEKQAARAALLQRRWPPAAADVPLRSYFGGRPRLAREQAWPVSADGRALTFLCQIDLADLPRDVATFDEAQDGTLLFFANTNFEGVGDPENAVLHRLGRGDAFDERPEPDNLMLAGGWREAQHYPWLEADEPGARGDLRQAMTFVSFTSYVDTEGEAVALWNTRTAHQAAYQALQMEAFRAALPPPIPRSERASCRNDPAWPASWIFVEHACRNLLTLLSGTERQEQDAIVEAVKAEAVAWRGEAGCGNWTATPADRRAAFRTWWEAARGRLNERLPEGKPRLTGSTFDEGEALAHELAEGLSGLAGQGAGSALRDAPWTWSEAERRTALPVIESSFPKHQVFGYGLSVQGAVAEHWDDVLLLQIACDDRLAWSKHCGYGVLQFWITHEALMERRYEEVVATFETD